MYKKTILIILVVKLVFLKMAICNASDLNLDGVWISNDLRYIWEFKEGAKKLVFEKTVKGIIEEYTYELIGSKLIVEKKGKIFFDLEIRTLQKDMIQIRIVDIDKTQYLYKYNPNLKSKEILDSLNRNSLTTQLDI